MTTSPSQYPKADIPSRILPLGTAGSGDAAPGLIQPRSRTHLLDVGLEGAVQAPGLHVLRNQSLLPEGSQGEPLLHRPQVRIRGFSILCHRENTSESHRNGFCRGRAGAAQPAFPNPSPQTILGTGIQFPAGKPMETLVPPPLRSQPGKHGKDPDGSHGKENPVIDPTPGSSSPKGPEFPSVS